MSKGRACFYCHHGAKGCTDRIGWSYDCSKGRDNTDLGDRPEHMIKCPEAEPRVGFQIGGYYTHMDFQEDGDCLTWRIWSDGNFPTDEPEIQFHICGFWQMEEFVAFWGPVLRKRFPRHFEEAADD